MNEVGISFGSVQLILTDNLRQFIPAKLILRTLTHNHKENHLQAVCDLLKCTNTDPEFTKNITGEKTKIYGYDPKKNKSSQWNKPQYTWSKK